ncbi:hypothetical protein ABGB12_34590 [Actinocorallia sp. B10E7]|uniref:hypothetical protein n=1 Tax=Actinocorallia sp. B10E7 TaxID=3153558 RepID=UPI00325F46E0
MVRHDRTIKQTEFAVGARGRRPWRAYEAITTGGVDTPLARGSMAAIDEALAYIESPRPANRITQPGEIAPWRSC